MIFLLSPSKTLDFKTTFPKLKTSTPEFSEETKKILSVLKKKSLVEIKNLMDLSDRLAELNKQRYAGYETAESKPAIFAFKGDVYEPLGLDKYGKPEIEYACEHIRIISGLYGLLNPLDLIKPHRLEMGVGLAVGKSKNLYEFWRNNIVKSINKYVNSNNYKILINIASQEYFRAIDTKKVNANIVDIVFKENKNGALKTIGINAKRARGLMADFAIINRIKDPEDLKKFKREGYVFNKSHSNDKEWVFTR